MSFLPQTAKFHADSGSSDAWQQALGLILALPLSLAGTAFLAYLLYAGSHLGS
jgi:hypothetical protein